MIIFITAPHACKKLHTSPKYRIILFLQSHLCMKHRRKEKVSIFAFLPVIVPVFKKEKKWQKLFKRDERRRGRWWWGKGRGRRTKVVILIQQTSEHFCIKLSGIIAESTRLHDFQFWDIFNYLKIYLGNYLVHPCWPSFPPLLLLLPTNEPLSPQ